MAARTLCTWIAVTSALFALGCAGDDEHLAAIGAEGEPVEPPFEVRGEAEGLLLVWFDEEGLHTASRRSDIPEQHRGAVRVDDLELAPDERLDPELVYVADLRRPAASGGYAVRRMRRAAFDAQVERAAGRGTEVAAAPSARPDGDEAPPSSDVVIYGASWCGACRSAAAFFRERGVEFVERDIEREPGAREAMQRAARAAGVSPSGIPVIDFRGRVIQGFDRGALERAIAETAI